jgi:sec-independent protein translocase protein TatC
MTHPDDARMPLIEHLRELRTRLLWCVYTMVPAFAASFLYSREIFDFLAAPMNDALRAGGGGSLAVLEFTEFFVVQMKVAGLAALFASAPMIAWQVWRFVAPGLYDTERRVVVPLALSSSTLFIGGAVFCYYAIFRLGFPFFLEMNGPDIRAVLSVNSYLGMVTTMLVSFGLAFQLPVVVWFLARLGLVDARDLIHGFRYAIVGIFIVAAILTPSPDAFTQALMAGPLVVLYVVGIAVAALSTTKKR